MARGAALSPSASELARTLHVRPGVGMAAHVMQGEGLKIVRVRVERPALILVDRGIKTVQPERGAAVRAAPGQALLLAGGQTVDFHNEVGPDAHYEARWLLFAGTVLDDPYYLSTVEKRLGAASSAASPSASSAAPVRALRRVSVGLAESFERARLALAPDPARPDAVVRQQLLEVAHWLLDAGLPLRAPAEDARISGRIRAMLSAELDADWTSARIAGALAMSEATLRRRLAAEGTTLSALIADVRMASALVLLQATARPVSEIALAVGYDSPSRFAVRFRNRFGFAPTAVRGHARPGHAAP